MRLSRRVKSAGAVAHAIFAAIIAITVVAGLRPANADARALRSDGEWAALPPGGFPRSDVPLGRWAHTAIYDSKRGRMVVFGGTNGAPLGDVWVRSLDGSGDWSQLIPTTPGPTPRFWHSAIYDELGDRMIVFGGDDGMIRNDLWALSFASGGWTRLLEIGPLVPRREHSAIYDPIENRMLVHGGYSGFLLSDTWELALDAPPSWVPLTSEGETPYARSGHTAIYDVLGRRMIVYGGDTVFARRTWALDLATTPTWREIVTSGELPGLRRDHAAVYDKLRSRMLIFGGVDRFLVGRNDSWTLSLGATPTWRRLDLDGEPPPPCRAPSAILDRVTDRLIVFGGMADVPETGTWAQTWRIAVGSEDAKADPVAAESSDETVAPAILLMPSVGHAAITIRLRNAAAGPVRLDVYDASGRRVRALHDGWLSSGESTIEWDGRGDGAADVPAGVYYVRLESDRGVAARRAVRF